MSMQVHNRVDYRADHDDATQFGLRQFKSMINKGHLGKLTFERRRNTFIQTSYPANALVCLPLAVGMFFGDSEERLKKVVAQTKRFLSTMGIEDFVSSCRLDFSLEEEEGEERMRVSFVFTITEPHPYLQTRKQQYLELKHHYPVPPSDARQELAEFLYNLYFDRPGLTARSTGLPREGRWQCEETTHSAHQEDNLPRLGRGEYWTVDEVKSRLLASICHGNMINLTRIGLVFSAIGEQDQTLVYRPTSTVRSVK